MFKVEMCEKEKKRKEKREHVIKRKTILKIEKYTYNYVKSIQI